ncbi:MAG: BON domain-containing protein [Gammaproteobacteria bacterium]|nr:BON domain-containing protein [Gammaproteobacteria bacterium]
MTLPVPKELGAELSGILERDVRINIHASPVSVWTAEGKVVLDGKVENIIAKRVALARAQQLVGDRWPILDLLRVVPGEPKEDLALRDEVVSALTKEPVFTDHSLRTKTGGEVRVIQDAGPGASEIEATIHNGSATLAGRVGSLTHRRLAEVLVWWTAGCEAVHNQLEVVPPQEDNDNEITDAVRIVLEKDPLVHASQLRVGTAGGVVVLSGSLASTEEKRLAVLDAWYVPGIWDVVDHIEVRS